MSLNLRQAALWAVILLVAVFAAGCGTSGDATVATTKSAQLETAQPSPSPSPSPSPVPAVGTLRLSVDTNNAVFAQAERVLLYLTDAASNYVGDPWSQGFDPNRVLYGPTEVPAAGFSVSPGQDPSFAWNDIPAKTYEGELLLLGDGGRPIGRQHLFSLQISRGQVTRLDRPNWATNSQAWAIQQRPVTWNHNGQAPIYESSPSTVRDVTGLNPLIGAGYWSIVMCDRSTRSVHYVGGDGRTGWRSSSRPEYIGADTKGFTTMYPWDVGWQYFSRANRWGVARFGVPFEQWSVEFNGLDVIALDGASGRIAALYQAAVTGEYRVRIAVGPPYQIEADFGLGGSVGIPTCLEFEPDLEGIWVGSQQGYALRFDLDGRWRWGIHFPDGDSIASLAMLDDRHLAIANQSKGEVWTVDTLLENWSLSPLVVPGVEQIVSCESDSRLAVVRTDPASGRHHLEWYNRSR